MVGCWLLVVGVVDVVDVVDVVVVIVYFYFVGVFFFDFSCPCCYSSVITASVQIPFHSMGQRSMAHVEFMI